MAAAPQLITKTANVKQGNDSSRPNISTGRTFASAGKSNAVEHSNSTGGLHRYRTEPRVRKAIVFMIMAKRIFSVTNSPLRVTILSLGAQKKKFKPNRKKWSTKEVTYEGWKFNSGNYLFTTDTK